MNKPFFSVIVPAHNAACRIRKGLGSIKRQTFTNYELIVVCDDCQDDTAAIAREYADKVLTVDWRNCGKTRNKGLDEARGKWILFMDDDDWWMSQDAFKIIADNVGKHGEDVLAFGFYWQDRGVMLPTKKHPFTAVWHKAWKREFIERIGARFPDWEHSDDDGFTKATLPHAKMWFLDQPLYYYNFMRPGSLTWRMQQGELSWDFPGR